MCEFDWGLAKLDPVSGPAKVADFDRSQGRSFATLSFSMDPHLTRLLQKTALVRFKKGSLFVSIKSN